MINTKAVARRTLVALSLPTTVAAVILGSSVVADAATPFGTPGEIVQQVSDGLLAWSVPAGVSSVHLRGGFVDETVAVKPGQTLILMPGSAARLSGAQSYYVTRSADGEATGTETGAEVAEVPSTATTAARAAMPGSPARAARGPAPDLLVPETSPAVTPCTTARAREARTREATPRS